MFLNEECIVKVMSDEGLGKFHLSSPDNHLELDVVNVTESEVTLTREVGEYVSNGTLSK